MAVDEKCGRFGRVARGTQTHEVHAELLVRRQERMDKVQLERAVWQTQELGLDQQRVTASFHPLAHFRYVLYQELRSELLKIIKNTNIVSKHLINLQ